MASHWNLNDQVDDYMPKFWGVFMMPLVTLGMFVLFLVIPNIDPLKELKLPGHVGHFFHAVLLVHAVTPGSVPARPLPSRRPPGWG
jgi:uncharacterized membrane protein